METIKNYLETMFMSLPDTPEVRKAKNELEQMMEDKYRSLLEEGQSENTAVGTVISEFGNLKELAEELGIEEVVNPRSKVQGNVATDDYILYGEEQKTNTTSAPKRLLSMDEVRGYLHDKANHTIQVALGVLLCIISTVGPIAADEAGNVPEGLGVLFMFACIGIAVALFIYSSIMMNKWTYIFKGDYNIDYATSGYVKQLKESYRTTYAILITVGVTLCATCFVPAAILDESSGFSEYGFYGTDWIGAVLLFLFVGIGVFMIIVAAMKNKAYVRLLHLNDLNSMGGRYREEEPKEIYSSKTLAAIMSVYWPTVTCIYLSLSFLTFAWYITWIIWPIAAVINSLVRNLAE